MLNRKAQFERVPVAVAMTIAEQEIKRATPAAATQVIHKRVERARRRQALRMSRET